MKNGSISGFFINYELTIVLEYVPVLGTQFFPLLLSIYSQLVGTLFKTSKLSSYFLTISVSLSS